MPRVAPADDVARGSLSAPGLTPGPGAAPDSGPEYAVPALDKALDILELLADTEGALGQAEIAAATGRSVNQIFRVLATLERRGYLLRDRQSGLYSLSLGLFDLAHRQEPLRGLVAAALPALRALADETQGSCNLSVLDAGRMRVVAQVVSPADFGFQVRVGALFGVETTASGLVLLAFGGVRVGGGGALEGVLQGIRSLGHLERPDSLQPGVTDIVFPVLDGRGVARAVLTVPYVATSFSEKTLAFVRERASAAAAAIAARLGGENREIS